MVTQVEHLERLVHVVSSLYHWKNQPLISHIQQYAHCDTSISFSGLLGVIRKWSNDICRELSLEEHAERLAFTFRTPPERSPDVKSPWGTYYGPIFNNPDPDSGKYSPDISEVTSVTIKYWKQRASSETNPVLKARYADLVWDLENKTSLRRKTPDYGILSIESYIVIAEGNLSAHSRQCWAGLRRSLEISKLMRRSNLEQIVVQAILKFEQKTADDNLPGTWGYAFGILINESPSSINQATENGIVKQLSGRFQKLINNPNTNPNGILSGFKLLGDYYLKKNDNVPEEIFIPFTDWMHKFAMTKEPMVSQFWLICTYFELHNRKIEPLAERVLLECEKLGLRVVETLEEHKQSTEIEQDKLDAALDSIFSEGLSVALSRIAISYRVRKKDLQDTVSKALEGLIWYQIAPPVEIDNFGRPLNAVNVTENGQDMMFHEGKQIVSFQYFLAMLALRKFVKRSKAPGQDILKHCFNSPLFDQNRKSLLERGIKAYVERDYIACVSILVPEIEHILRFITRKLDIPTWEPNRGQTFHVKTLGTLLGDERLAEVMGETLFGFVFLFADTRGFNIRNNFCHGIMQPSNYNEQVSTMLIHLLLCIGLFRERQAENEKQDTETKSSHSPLDKDEEKDVG